MTIDGFAMGPDPAAGFPRVDASLSVTTYIVPPEEGIAAGATPAGPAPAEPVAPTPASTGSTR
jgi:hypothetical protein